MKKKSKPKKENSERWLLTYSDLITLLMILFILLFAMGNVDQQKYEQLAEALSNTMGNGASVLDGSSGVLPDNGNTIIGQGQGPNSGKGDSSAVSPTKAPEATITPEPTKAPEDTTGSDDLPGSIQNEEDMKNFETYIDDALKDMKLGDYVSTTMITSGMTVSFADDIFFDSGQDILKPDMKKALDTLSKLLQNIDNTIIIEGHTDNVPISNTSKYVSNWQLSAGRAANVAQYLVEKKKIEGKRVAAVGYGEFHPKATNATAKGRSQNRRIDMVILYDNQVGLEYNK